MLTEEEDFVYLSRKLHSQNNTSSEVSRSASLLARSGWAAASIKPNLDLYLSKNKTMCACIDNFIFIEAVVIKTKHIRHPCTAWS